MATVNKPMDSRFSGTCKVCKCIYTKGERIVWHGRGNGVSCARCYRRGVTARNNVSQDRVARKYGRPESTDTAMRAHNGAQATEIERLRTELARLRADLTQARVLARTWKDTACAVTNSPKFHYNQAKAVAGMLASLGMLRPVAASVKASVARFGALELD